MKINECRLRIARFLRRPGMNKIILADYAKVHRNTLTGIERENWNPAAKTLEQIMDAVNRLERAQR